jgi:ATP-dependent Clp protease protease subunit
MRRFFLALILIAATFIFATAAIVKPHPVVAQKGTILLNTTNTVNFRGPVTGDSTTQATLELVRLVKERGSKKYPIYLVLNTPGGSVYDGLNFISFLESLQNVHTITLFAASMGSAIVEANPGRRYITKNGILMFHRAKGGFQGQFEDGEVEQQLKLWKAIVRGMEQVNADRMSMPLSTYKEKVKDELWIYGADNIKQKAADELVAIKCSDELMEAREMGSEAGMFVQVRVTYSGCPLLQNPISIEKED